MDKNTRCRRSLPYEEIERILSEMRIYEYNGTKIRVVDSDGEPWIVFADICKALGYKNPNHESKKIPPEEKRKLEIGLKNTLAVGVSKRGLLSFTLFSNKLHVAEFRAWATTEIFGDNLQPNQIGGDHHGHSTADTLSPGHA